MHVGECLLVVGAGVWQMPFHSICCSMFDIHIIAGKRRLLVNTLLMVKAC